MPERKPWFQKIASLFGVKATNTKYHAAPPIDWMKRLLGSKRRSKHSDFASKAMRRGVQMSMERRQRPARLAFLIESCRQALENRKAFRENQLAARDHRRRDDAVELRVSAAIEAAA